ncbi:hypothetical protein GCM10017667_34570 [Streptomyces filamentosus]|uniref:Uncharacterized protein n=1 Tax=Streptomyces filamentosus TaxID=67294 RepID=A0A919BNK7_STRFL|nr:hypothetical protein GCM10017667_34570 [Streptomyces filamentosus]
MGGAPTAPPTAPPSRKTLPKEALHACARTQGENGLSQNGLGGNELAP